MTYSLDLRERVVHFVNNGGRKAEASRKYEVSLWCVNDWCKRSNLSPKVYEVKQHKFDWELLRQQVESSPDLILEERAKEFAVHTSAIWYALKKMGINYKKNFSVQGKKGGAKAKLPCKAKSKT